MRDVRVGRNDSFMHKKVRWLGWEPDMGEIEKKCLGIRKE